MYALELQDSPLFVAEEDPKAPQNRDIPDLSFLDMTFEGFRPSESERFPTKGRREEIKPISRTKCAISIGTPITTKLTRQTLKTLDPGIQTQTATYDFYTVMLACSFSSSHLYPFVEATFGVELQAEDQSGTALPNAAIAYDIYPLRVEEDHPVYRKVALNTSLKFTCLGNEATLTLPGFEQTDSYVEHIGHIEGFDLQGTTPGWRFQRTKMRPVSGSHRLFVLLRAPRKSRVKATFQLEARIQALRSVHQLALRFRKGADEAHAEVPSTYLC